GTMRNISTQADKNLKISLMARHAFAYSEMTSTVHRVWRWILIGVGLGALLHGFVPQEWFTKNFGTSQWWSVPVAVAVGIPLYTNVTGVIPVMESLLIKGLPLGTTLAFCMSTVAVSLPEIFMLKQAMQWKLITVFLFILITIFIFIGFLFNAIRI
ncbi:MAG: permease, partial [Pseudomonadota bacterium]|nr:permease [Pseudomonadota bacterium]